MSTENAHRGIPGSQIFLYRYAQFLVAAVVFLLVAGAMVTSTGSGLAVPDWPLSFGQLMPPMEGGVFYEHGHRMVATAIGLLTMILAVWLWRAEKRRWLRRLGWAALGLVILQGLMGGLTVLMKLPVWTSTAHACLAQAFFMVTVLIALSLSPGWRLANVALLEGSSRLTVWSSAATVVLYVQLILGAVMRHMNAGLAIPDFPLAFGGFLPEVWTPTVAIHMAHRLWAVVVALTVIGAGHVALRQKATQFAWPARILLVLLVVQIGLGASVIWTQRHVHVTSTHVVVGALLLAASLVLTARSWRVQTYVPADTPEAHESRLERMRV